MPECCHPCSCGVASSWSEPGVVVCLGLLAGMYLALQAISMPSLLPQHVCMLSQIPTDLTGLLRPQNRPKRGKVRRAQAASQQLLLPNSAHLWALRKSESWMPMSCAGSSRGMPSLNRLSTSATTCRPSFTLIFFGWVVESTYLILC